MSQIVAAIAGLFGSVLYWFYNLIGGNFGVAIIVFTIVTKVLVFPIFFKQQKSTRAMQEMVPLQEKIQKKYKNDQQKQAEELSKLYKEKKINPMAGCLPAIITSIILISMFYIVKYPLSYMKKLDYIDIQQEAVLLKDKIGLQNPDNYAEVSTKEIDIAINSDNPKFQINMTIFGINLGLVPWNNITTQPILLLIPILSVLTSWYFNRMVRKFNGSINAKKKKPENGKEEDFDMMNQMQKNMGFMMPIMSGYLALIMPAALGLYWLIGYAFQILQYVLFEIIEKKQEGISVKCLKKGDESNV